MRVILFDIESTGLEMTARIHCIGVKVIDNGVSQPTKCFTSLWTSNSDGNLKSCLKLLATADILVGFNSINFDIPLLEAFFNLNVNAPAHLDLIILAKLMFTKDQLMNMDRGIPAIEKKSWGSFSLDTFGKRLGTQLKGSHSDWTRLTTDMVTYCKQDVEVTHDLYLKLCSMDNYPLQSVIDLEQQVAALIQKQEQTGFYFDIVKARQLSTAFLFQRNNIDRKLTKAFRPMFIPDGPVKETNRTIRRKLYVPSTKYIDVFAGFKPYYKPLKRFKSGKIRLPGKKVFKWFNKPMLTVIQEKAGEYQNIKLTKFTATDNQIKLWLKRLYNFEFDTYTAKGNVKVDRGELLKLGTHGEDLRKLIKLKKDLSQLSGTENSLIAKYNEKTHSIHGHVDTIGAATHRCTHNGPNLAQIPADGDFRGLFTVPEGWVLVGADLANIEVRVLAHYLAEHGNTDYAKAVLSKDMHWFHAKLAGFWTVDDREWPDDTHADQRTHAMKEARIASKKFFFGYLYGQGDTVRGFTLWTDSIEQILKYTQSEYDAAEKRINKRLNGEGLFPLKKDLFVQPTKLLIKQTIYGKQVANDFLKNLSGIQELIKACQTQSKTKRTVTAIDGRELFSRSPHSALNLLLQGSAGVIGKRWMVNYHALAHDKGLIRGCDWNQYAYIHDEFQTGCIKDKAKELCDVLEEGAAMITDQFKMNLPIKADATIGQTWVDTH